MTIDHRNALAAIRQFDQLIAFLRDEMDWPIVSDDFEELTFEYSAEELGIDAANAAKIQEIKRLRPLATEQPWGIFFLKFEPKRLPVVALRSILGRVALKKRASSNNAERPAWAMDDLLFISNYGEGDARQISFAHFAAPAVTNKLPTLKVIAWDDRDTALHLDQVAHELTNGLAWPIDDGDADAWRARWRAAFTLGYRESITTAHQLSVLLAKLATVTRNRILGALDIENKNGRITRLMNAFSEALVNDLDAQGFADMVAQTIAYGLLSARVADPQQASASELASHMRTNPLLRDLMTSFLEVSDQQRSMGIDFDELGVAEVVELLDHANMDAVVSDFGDKNPREDPVIHFYESFLSEYDKQKKVERGVFYTPRPVVSYIVRSVDQLLRTEFGLEDGLADVTTWGELTKRHKHFNIPKGVSPDQDFVQILDPATGTGTFLVEAIELIHSTLVDKWEAQGCHDREVEALWNEYVPEHLLPRLHGYELLMAPYAIAHLKIGLKLYETGYRFGSDERAKVYLTNTLEPAQDFSGMMGFAVPALADEANAVNQVKDKQRFTVIIGNPPYSGHSANRGQWIRNLLRGTEGNEKTGSYYHLNGETLGERTSKWLNDDYVKFLRYAHRQIERTGEGVLGFITNHSYLDNPTFRGMRQSLMGTFERLYLLDLHGNSKKNERTPAGNKDENVFNIQQGVAIGLFLKRADGADVPARVLHANLWGERDAGPEGGKYGWLVANDVEPTRWAQLTPKSPRYLFVPRDETRAEEYEAGWRLDDAFLIYGAGMTTAHDGFVINDDREDLVAQFEEFRRTERSRDVLHSRFNVRRKKGWDILDGWDHLQNAGELNRFVKAVCYRPFDNRFIFYEDRLVWRTVKRVMRHMQAGENLGLITCRQQSQMGVDWSHCGVTRSIIESSAISNKTREINYLFPLYTYPDEPLSYVAAKTQPNLRHDFITAFGTAVGLTFVSEQRGDLKMTFGSEDVFNYIYAVLHSNSYRKRYADFLKSDFPRVLLPGDRALFGDLIRRGTRLANLHLVEVEDTTPQTCLSNIGNNRVDKVRYASSCGSLPGRVWINHDQYFDGIEPEVWEFTIGSYRPAEKWLKDRTGRVLSDADIYHYQKIVAALTDSRRLMHEIDELIEQHGGWPGAFN